MGFSMPTFFTSWSFSRWADYDRCPRYAKYKHLDKLPEPKHPAMARGIDIAEKTEAYMKKEASRLPVELKLLGDDYRELRKSKTLEVEAGWNFTSTWEPTVFNDWNNCVLRMKVDMFEVLEGGKVVSIIDNKTGKFNAKFGVEKYELQLGLYIAGGGIIFPKAKEFHSRLWYTDQGIKYPEAGPRIVTAKDSANLRKEWDKRVKPMLNDRKFAPKPGAHCQWCPHSKNAVWKTYNAKGELVSEVPHKGPCKF